MYFQLNYLPNCSKYVNISLCFALKIATYLSKYIFDKSTFLWILVLFYLHTYTYHNLPIWLYIYLCLRTG